MTRLILCAAVAVSAAACTSSSSAGDTSTASTEQASATLTDPQIAHIAVTANQIDIDAGKLALERSQDPKVREFAQRMIDDHVSVIQTASELVTRLGVTPQDNDVSKSLQAGAEKKRDQLQSLEGTAFTKAYVDNEVAYHQAVIDAVKNTLIPGAQNAELKALLEKVAPALEAHLEHAKHLQHELAGG